MKRIVLLFALLATSFCWVGYSQAMDPICNEREIPGFAQAAETPENFSFHPNPAHDRLSFVATRKIQEIVVYDRLGRQSLKTNPGSLLANLNISGLHAGIYLMNVTIDNKVRTYKLVKN